MDDSVSVTELIPAEGPRTRLFYARSHVDVDVRVDVITPSRIGERVLGSVELPPYGVGVWRGRVGRYIDVKVHISGEIMPFRVNAPEMDAPLELLIQASRGGEATCVLSEARDSSAFVGGRVATIDDLHREGALNAASGYVEGGFQIVRPGTSYRIMAPKRVLCPPNLWPVVGERCVALFGEKERPVPDFTVGSIQNARVMHPRHMSVVTGQNRLVKEQQNLPLMLRDPGYRAMLETRDLRRIKLFEPKMLHNRVRRIERPVFIFGNGMGLVYGHWLVDLMPRLLAAEKIRGFESIDILLPSRKLVLDLWLEVFAMLNIDPERVVYFDELAEGDNVLEFAEVICPGFQHIENWDSIGNVPSPVAAEFYRSMRDMIATTAPFRRVYVSRAEANTRRMANEEELRALLTTHGFEIVIGEYLSFTEKLRLFSETKVIAGLMGSNLMNSLMMPPGGLVLEIFGHEYMLDAIRPVAAVSGHDYAAIIGESVGDQPRRRKDIAAPVEILRRELPALLEAKA